MAVVMGSFCLNVKYSRCVAELIIALNATSATGKSVQMVSERNSADAAIFSTR